ncbi:Non-specific lipid-transfer protein [Quillaja saponaria]|uniref:Non-specific lipid-transfer protein n=1 Tax=Quillaja saponaria TaxID=32244 RepID=A0AAD7PNC5_QUISA|nr:Non-specific lipid-transfer protein [Quillaja saponaria]
MAGLKLAFVVLMCLVVAAPIAQAITCGQVAGSVSPCLNYLRGVGPLPGGCCNGVRSLLAAAKTTADRQAICNCLKSAAGSLPGLKPNLAAGLPGACRVNIPYKISTSTNCASIK